MLKHQRELERPPPICIRPRHRRGITSNPRLRSPHRHRPSLDLPLTFQSSMPPSSTQTQASTASANATFASHRLDSSASHRLHVGLPRQLCLASPPEVLHIESPPTTLPSVHQSSVPKRKRYQTKRKQARRNERRVVVSQALSRARVLLANVPFKDVQVRASRARLGGQLASYESLLSMLLVPKIMLTSLP
jgi:hypothetical protein